MKIIFKRAFTYITLTLIAIIQIYPLIWTFFLSLKNNSEIFGGNTLGFPRVMRWENYKTALSTGNVFRYMSNSTIVTVITVIISTLLASMVAYSISRMHWKGGKLTLNLFLTGVMIPSQAIILPIYIYMHKTGLYNTHTGLILVYIAFCMPVAIYIIAGFMQSLPKELEEAATIDGANIYYIFFLIIFPIIRPALAAVIVFSFLGTWNEFMYSFILVDKENLRTLTVGLLSMKGRYNTEWGPMAAGLMMATVPTLLIYLLLSGNIQKSFIAGAVKG